MMDRSTPSLSYQAWRRDPENGPPQYRSRTVFEDATPEMVRDLFWDDDFRLKWDDMLIYAETLEECPNTGTMVVRWVRKVGRELFFLSSLILMLYANNLIPMEITLKIAEKIRARERFAAYIVIPMWPEGNPIEQNNENDVREYPAPLTCGATSQDVLIHIIQVGTYVQVNIKVSADFLRSLESTSGSSEVETPNSSEKPSRRNMPKFLFIGGAIVLACSLDRGLLTKAVIFGVAKRFTKIDLLPCLKYVEGVVFFFLSHEAATVLKDVMDGDSLPFTEHQELLDAFVRVHFHSSANNLIPMEIALKIAEKIKARERFAAYIVIPMSPEGNPIGAATQRILFWQETTTEAVAHTAAVCPVSGLGCNCAIFGVVDHKACRVVSLWAPHKKQTGSDYDAFSWHGMGYKSITTDRQPSKVLPLIGAGAFSYEN
ncbi:hypothetical protein TEA_010388 [Camellia sinensis var. sinensis]|uniref:START domain-containing protein n=1 Tax=Camellia sinensis var. sinensis TaxID=542762 RepID=A0A4S4DVX3_CAMSN|nr:hypothetical protein TEA_010388 [Camellia sinensis var. sinensis]